MNALESNAWTQHLTTLAKTLPRPKGIVCVSAHWVSPKTLHLHHPKPRTIHDFYGFPEALTKICYPAPGYLIKDAPFAEPDEQWGFDHGTWSVLHHMYPDAQIPVTQLSLSGRLSFKEHTALGQQMRKWREEEILILGSGNITHNLRDIDLSGRAKPRDWAVEFDARTMEALQTRDFAWLWNERQSHHKLWQVAHPTLEHYWPLLYALGSSDEDDTVSFPFNEIQLGSLAMRSVLFN